VLRVACQPLEFTGRYLQCYLSALSAKQQNNPNARRATWDIQYGIAITDNKCENVKKKNEVTAVGKTRFYL
jgi:hypothetical protein